MVYVGDTFLFLLQSGHSSLYSVNSTAFLFGYRYKTSEIIWSEDDFRIAYYRFNRHVNDTGTIFANLYGLSYNKLGKQI